MNTTLIVGCRVGGESWGATCKGLNLGVGGRVM
jgi:hypothetical protein